MEAMQEPTDIAPNAQPEASHEPSVPSQAEGNDEQQHSEAQQESMATTKPTQFLPQNGHQC